VPWAYDYSKWYHQYPRFPKEALEAASFLSEYTITDLGTWISATDSVKSRLKIYNQGSNDASDPLLNPAHLLLGARASSSHADLCMAFVDWVIASNGGQAVIRTFAKSGQVLYSEAPSS
jgi:ABC-type tungstate transport system permease subunit